MIVIHHVLVTFWNIFVWVDPRYLVSVRLLDNSQYSWEFLFLAAVASPGTDPCHVFRVSIPSLHSPSVPTPLLCKLCHPHTCPHMHRHAHKWIRTGTKGRKWKQISTNGQKWTQLTLNTCDTLLYFSWIHLRALRPCWSMVIISEHCTRAGVLVRQLGPPPVLPLGNFLLDVCRG